MGHSKNRLLPFCNWPLSIAGAVSTSESKRKEAGDERAVGPRESLSLEQDGWATGTDADAEAASLLPSFCAIFFLSFRGRAEARGAPAAAAAAEADADFVVVFGGPEFWGSKRCGQD